MPVLPETMQEEQVEAADAPTDRGGARGDFVAVALAVAASLALYAVLAAILAALYQPDPESASRAAALFVQSSQCRPEPLERLLFLTALVTIPPCVFASVALARRLAPKLRCAFWPALVAFLAGLAALAYADLAAVHDFYVRNNLLYTNPVLQLAITAVATVAVLLPLRRWHRNVLLGVFALCVAGVVWFVFAVDVFSVQDVTPSTKYDFHFEAIFYSVEEVFSGKAMLLDIRNTYGLYPHLLEPILRLLGRLTVLKFTIVMAVLHAVSLLCMLAALWLVVRSPILRALGFLTVFFFINFFHRPLMGANDPYFQYWPLRILFPGLLLVLASVYFKKGRPWAYWSVHIASGVAVLWNADSGLVVLGTWLLALGYHELFQPTARDALRGIARHAAIAVLVVGGVAVAFMVWIRLRNGGWIPLSELTAYQRLFYLSGYYMLPMPLVHPWNLLLLAYVAALAWAARSLVRRVDRFRSTVVFMLGVLGFGAFAYYQGRSHDLSLIGPSYPFLLLLPVFADALVALAREEGRWRPEAVLLALPILHVLASGASSLFVPSSWGALKDVLVRDRAPPDNVTGGVNFIRANTRPGEKVFILSPNQGVYYAETETASAIDAPGLVDSILVRDIEDQIAFLREQKDTKVFYDAMLGDFAGFLYLLKREYVPVAVSDDRRLILLWHVRH